MSFLILTVAFLGGLAGHQTHHFTRNIKNGWRNLAEHGIGGLLLLPFMLLFWPALGGNPKDIPRLLATCALSLLGVGAGVSFGWLLDNVTWIQDEK